MDKALTYIRVTSTSPACNLALEEAFFSCLESERYFLLWQNAPSVIIGRHQNACEEINAAEVERRQLPVVRRSTGGGAVYHDPGNLNFSFLERRQESGSIDFARYLAPIVRALARLGVQAEISGRNDLEVQGRKISGSAQRLAQGRVLHHGTLLVQANFEDMTRALSPDPGKFLSHGVASVRARVANISEFWNPGESLESLCRALCEETGAVPGRIPAHVLARAEELQREKYGSWAWNMGQNPKFTAQKSERFPWGRVDVRFNVEKGRITDCRIFGDYFAVADISVLEGCFAGCRAEKTSMADALDAVLKAGRADLDQWFSGCDTQVMREFLLSVF